MQENSATEEQRFATVVEAFLRQPNVTYGSDEAKADRGGGNRFGAGALKVGGRIFAMLVRGRLVVKLPRKRVDALVASGDGERFDPRHGQPMKEWLTLDGSSQLDWLSLAGEALAFVGKNATPSA